ncbi:MAG: hypothetical protein EB127_08865 [Alphaproteobacteria bacterium]|nr:hypothetical protein [Alphaproteobacteria bacterium]
MNEQIHEYLDELKKTKDIDFAQKIRKHLIPEESFDTQMQKAAKIYKDEKDIISKATELSNLNTSS